MKYKPSKYKSSTMSVTPMIGHTKQSANLSNQMQAAETQLNKAMEYVLLDAMTFLKRELHHSAPDIDGYKYADELEMMLMPTSSSVETFLVYKNREVDVGSVDSGAFYFYGDTKKYPYLAVLNKYQPLPSSYVTFELPKTISCTFRKITEQERASLEYRTNANLNRINRELVATGAPFRIEYGQGGKGKTREDMGFNVLRSEYGYNAKQESHWRPAIKGLSVYMPKLGVKMQKYMLTGNKNVFDIDDYETASQTEIERYGEKFSDMIGKSLRL